MTDSEFELPVDSCFDPQRRFEILRDIFDSLSDHVAVLDLDGRIVDANASWRRFVAENPGATLCRIEGENYIEVCENSSGAFSEEACAAAAGIRAVDRKSVV